MTKLKERIRKELDEKTIELLESEFIVKLAEAFPGAKVVYAKRHEHTKVGND
jgi:hypothetical protein|tara:strand:- start:528 stop:683 length:156 start_codon:yes stop_codon:yes gene_type:complete